MPRIDVRGVIVPGNGHVTAVRSRTERSILIRGKAWVFDDVPQYWKPKVKSWLAADNYSTE